MSHPHHIHRHLNRIVLTVTVALAFCAAPAQAYLALLRQGVESAEVPNSGDLFGYTLATGDFDGDGYDDLAVAAPWEANGLINTAAHGLVTVNWGTVYGLGHQNAATLSPGTPLDDSVKFGYALAVGDFNGDGFDDLAVGLPDNDNGAVVDAGGVWIYDGFSGGIQLAPSLMLSESNTGGIAENDDNFGFTLATGDFNGDGYDDLAIGTIGEDSGTGDVTVVRSGGAAGLSPATSTTFHPGVLGGSLGSPGGWFGKALATGDLDQDGFDDLVVGAPKTTVGAVGSSGRVYVLYGGGSGISATGTWKWDTSNDPGWLQNTALELGWSLAIGDFSDLDGNAPLQFIAGAPGYESGGQNDTGAFVLFSHDDASRALGNTRMVYNQPANQSNDQVLTNDRFGETLATGDFDGDGFADLAVGAVSNNITEQAALGAQLDAGSAYLYTRDGTVLTLDTHITHVTLNDHVFGGDNLGRGLAFGRFEGGGRAALAVGAPYGDDFSYEGDPTVSNTGRVYIHAPWRQPRNRPHRGSAALDCNGYLIYAQRAWQRMRPASTTKTMTLQLACDALDQGQDPNQLTTIPSWVANNVGGSQAGHLQGDRLTFFDLFKTMMTVSGNDSAMWLGSLISGEGLGGWTGWSTQSPGFAADMENQADDFGMSSATSFTNAAGIDSGDHYTTPLDFAIMSWQAIQDPCVKGIVNQPSWFVPVQRIGANGIPGQYGNIILQFTNGFVNGVRGQNPSAVGMKGGQTPGALRTGVYNSYVPLAAAHNAASGFGVWDDDIPVLGTIADCNGCIGAELLAIADLYCQQAAMPDDIVMPDPVPGPWSVLRDLSSAAEDTARGLVFNAAGTEANELGRLIQVDLLRANQAWPTANVTALLRHTSEFCVSPGRDETVGTAPYQQHDGFVISNRGAATVTISVTASDPAGYQQIVTLAPDDSFSVPATDGSAPAPSFQLSVANLSSTANACLEVQEMGYRSQVSLGDGISLPDVATFHLERVLSALDDSWSLEFLGLDPQPGNLLDVSAHDPGASSSVGDGPGLPVAPRPVLSRLLPNVPNPFNPSTTIRFDLAGGGTVDLRVFDVRGRLVRTLAAGAIYVQGRHEIVWDGRDERGQAVASGVYVVELTAGNTRQSQQVMLLK
ncbi:MAG: FG-GAP repeat protein [bacterium]|nr:FG-GAP repeat protein [bacterium]